MFPYTEYCPLAPEFWSQKWGPKIGISGFQVMLLAGDHSENHCPQESKSAFRVFLNPKHCWPHQSGACLLFRDMVAPVSQVAVPLGIERTGPRTSPSGCLA